MQQAVSQTATASALGRKSDRLLILVGHDTNLTNISGAFGLSWLIDGRRDDTPPGGALVFELWQNGATSKYSVRLFYTAQTLDQMRNVTPLTLENPPERVPVFVPGCSRADGSCDWSAFQSLVHATISTDRTR
jgi:4-phytase/acid phosphatase